MTRTQRAALLHIQNILMQAHAIAVKEDLIVADEIQDAINAARKS